MPKDWERMCCLVAILTAVVICLQILYIMPSVSATDNNIRTTRQGYDVAIKNILLDDADYGDYYAPERTINVYVEVTNAGTSSQDVELYLNLTTYDGTVISTQKQSFNLSLGNDYVITFTITTPADDGNYTVIATLIPINPPYDDNYGNNVMTSMFRVKSVYDVEAIIMVPSNGATYRVGDTINITYQIHNSGTITVDVLTFVSLYNIDTDEEIFNHTETLGSMLSGDMRFINITYTTEEKDQGNISLRVGAIIQRDDYPGNNIDEIRLFIGDIYNFIVTLQSPANVDVHCSETATFTVRISNIGNVPINIGFKLSYPCDHWVVTVDGNPTVTINPDEVTEVDVSIAVPDNANATIYYLKLIAYIYDNPSMYAYVDVTINVLPSAKAIISYPKDGDRYYFGEDIYFDGAASYSPDPKVSIISYMWRSSIDGDLSTQATFTKNDLSPGTHVITLQVEGSDGTIGQDHVTITVGELRVFTSDDGRLSVLIPYFGLGDVYISSADDPKPEGTDGLVYIYRVSTDIPEGDWDWAKITIKYDESDIAEYNESSLGIWYWSEDDQDWHWITTNQLDTINNVVSVNVTHFTIFALIGKKDSGGGTIQTPDIKGVYKSPDGEVTVGYPIEITCYVLGGTPPYTFIWNLGDGTISTTSTSNITHVYTATGTYTVNITVRDYYFYEDYASVEVYVVNNPPNIMIDINGKSLSNYKQNGIITLSLGYAYNFSASGSSDPDGHEISNVEWDFDEGNGTLKGEKITYAFTKIGLHMVKVTVIDKYGGKQTNTFEINVVEKGGQQPQLNEDTKNGTTKERISGMDMTSIVGLVIVFVVVIIVILVLLVVHRHRYKGGEWDEYEDEYEDWDEEE